MTTQATDNDATWRGYSSRRPWIGLTLLGISIFSTLAVLIYFGAWVAQDRIEARADEGAAAQSEGEWWEDSLIAVCPIH